MNLRGVQRNITAIIQVLYKNNRNKVGMQNPESLEFKTSLGLQQGCVLSPLLFSIGIDGTISECKEKCKNMTVGKWKMVNGSLQELLFADDVVLIAETEEKL